MAPSSPWPLIHAEREALAGDLATLTSEQWATPSLCTGWTVRDVLGHMTSTAKATPAAFLAGFAGTGFNFHAFNQKRVTQEATAAPADGLAEFRRHLTATSHPPGPGETWLAETVIHAEDIRRPLGIKRDYPAQTLT